MKRLVIILLVTGVCSNAMAGLSSESFESLYDDFLELLNLDREHEVPLEDVDINYNTTPDSQGYTTSDDGQYLYDSTLPDAVGSFGTGQEGSGGSTSVITNPEPCSIILTSIGLGIAGYFKRSRVI